MLSGVPGYKDRVLRAFASCGALWPESGIEPQCLEEPPQFRILLIVAHPDDESECAVTLYRAAHELGAVVDQLFVTNGEAGERYTGPALPYYRWSACRGQLKGRSLASIRRAEVMRASRILGVSGNFFLNQPDTGYTLDPEEALRAWNVAYVREQLLKLLKRHAYDLVITLLPSPDTHGHHKTVAYLCAETISELPVHGRPAFLGVRTANSCGDTVAWTPEELTIPATTRTPAWFMDRRTPFADHPELDYRIVANWVVAEHKSQGLVQMNLGRWTHECFWLFEVSGGQGRHCWERFRDRISRLGLPLSEEIAAAAGR